MTLKERTRRHVFKYACRKPTLFGISKVYFEPSLFILHRIDRKYEAFSQLGFTITTALKDKFKAAGIKETGEMW